MLQVWLSISVVVAATRRRESPQTSISRGESGTNIDAKSPLTFPISFDGVTYESLYDPSGHVHNFSPEEMTILTSGNESQPWHVTFYDDQCGGCQHEVRVTKYLACRFPQFSFGAFNCRQFSDMCEDRLGIDEYPTKLFFNMKSRENVGLVPHNTTLHHGLVDQCAMEPFSAVTECFANVTGLQPQNTTPCSTNMGAGNRQGWPPTAFGRPSERLQEALEMFMHDLRQHNGSKNVYRNEVLGTLQRALPCKVSRIEELEETGEEPRHPKYLRWHPSAVWTIFHAISFSGIACRDVVRFMEAFVNNLFTCSECRKHMTSMWENSNTALPSNSCRLKDIQLYLWKAHNAVSISVVEPGGQTRLWPPQDKCPTCYTSSDASPSLSFGHGTTQEVFSALNDANETAVIQFLQNTYGDACTHGLLRMRESSSI